MSSLFGASTGQGIHCMQEWLHVGGSGCVNHISGQAPCSGGADQQKSDSIIFMIALFCSVYVRKNMKLGVGLEGVVEGKDMIKIYCMKFLPYVCLRVCMHVCSIMMIPKHPLIVGDSRREGS